MAAVAERRAYQLQVSSLLAELDDLRAQIDRLRAIGVRPAGLRDLKCDLESARRRLTELVSARRTRPDARSARRIGPAVPRPG
jgi:uncharacterized protein involved in exopolysaccharide biosynthesis